MSRRASPKRINRCGFTLMEMIVATFLLAIGVAGALAAFASATRATTAADRLNTAALLAQRKMSEIEMQGSSLTGGDQQGDFSPEHPEYRWHESVETSSYPNLFKVTLTIQWGTSTSSNERNFVTYLINNPYQSNLLGTTTSAGGGQSGG